MPAENAVMLRRTAYPLVVHESVGDADIVGVVPHGHARPLDERVAKGVSPVVEIVESNAFPGRDCRGLFVGCRQRQHLELLVIGNQPMRPGAARGHPVGKDLAWAVSERGMWGG